MSRLQINVSEVVNLYAKDGLTATEIAGKIGCSINTVLRRLKGAGVQIRPNGSERIGKPLSKEHREAIRSGHLNSEKTAARKTRVTIKCEWCGKYVEKHLAHMKGRKHQFCCHECYSAWRSENIRGEDHPLYRRVELTCPQCGKSFNMPPNRVKNIERVFCCKECHNDWMHENQRGENNPFWHGGKTRWPGRGNGRRYRQLREDVFARDEFKCTKCGRTDNLELHHIKGWADYPKLRYNPDNCTTLCRECHLHVGKGV